MRKLILNLTLTIFAVFYSFGSSSSNFNDTEYYLINSSTSIGTISSSGFKISRDIINKTISNDYAKINIEKYEILNTSEENFKYLVIYGVSEEKDPDGKDNKAFYKIAYPISSSKEFKSSETTHTCKSYDGIIFGCSCCTFIKDKKGIITGCQCCEFGWCTHEVSRTDKLPNSLMQLFI